MSDMAVLASPQGACRCKQRPCVDAACCSGPHALGVCGLLLTPGERTGELGCQCNPVLHWQHAPLILNHIEHSTGGCAILQL